MLHVQGILNKQNIQFIYFIIFFDCILKWPMQWHHLVFFPCCDTSLFKRQQKSTIILTFLDIYVPFLLDRDGSARLVLHRSIPKPLERNQYGNVRNVFLYSYCNPFLQSYLPFKFFWHCDTLFELIRSNHYQIQFKRVKIHRNSLWTYHVHDTFFCVPV